MIEQSPDRRTMTKPQLLAEVDGLRASLERERATRLEMEKTLAQALEQQRATGEILRVISHSPSDLSQAGGTILANATRLCEAELGNLFVYDREQDAFHAVAHHNASQLFRDVLSGALRPGPETSVERLFEMSSPFQIPDVRVTEAYRDSEPYAVVAADLEGIRTLLAVPFARDGQLVGVITIYRREIRLFTPEQIDLLKTFADQAVIAIENVRLFTELRESLEHQTAISDILGVISRSPTHIQPVLDTIVERAAKLTAGSDAVMFLARGDVLELASVMDVTFGERAISGEEARQQLVARGEPDWGVVPTTADYPPGRCVRQRQVIHQADTTMMVTEGYDPVVQQFFLGRGFRSWIQAPLLRAEAAIGALSVYRRSAEPFSPRQIQLLQTFADQAVIAIENVRLFKELEARNRELTDTLEQQTATSEILQVISSSPTDVQPTFDAIAASARQLCEADNAFVFRFDGTLIHLAAHNNLRSEELEAIRSVFPIPPGRGSVTARAILTRSLVHVRDRREDSELQYSALSTLFPNTLSVPLLREGVPLGAITVTRTEIGLFSDRQVALLQTFADQAVIAIENVRLFTELQASNRELTTALDQQTATSDILRVISQSQTEVQPVFDAIVASAVRLLRGNASTLSRIGGDQIVLAAMTSTDDPGDASQRARFPMSIHSEEDHAQAVRNRVPLHSTDAHSDPRLPETQHASARLRGYRSLVVVPLVRHDEAVGALGVARREPGGFTDDEIALLKTFADQAVIAIENVRLFNELEGRNRELTATAKILRVISSSPTDVQPVFDTIVRSAVRLCDGLFSSLHQFDGELLHQVAQHNLTPEALEIAHHIFPARPTRALFPGRAILDRAVVHIPDVKAKKDDQHHALTRAVGMRSGLFVPMLREGTPIGVVGVARAEPGPFSDSEIELLKTFADQAVIAIENVRLFKELQARTGELTQSVEQLTALGEVSRAVSSTLDVETVLDTIVTRASQLAGAAGCSIYEYDEGAEQFELRATHNDDTAFVEALRAVPLRKGEGLMGRAAEMREPIQIPDITQPGAYESSVRDTLIRFGYRALLSVPLLCEDQIIGSLSFNRKAPGEFPPEVVDVLKTFATQSALAIQNARLFREIADKSAQLEAASRHKSQFLANMSHELRTPLNAIIGFSEVLVDRMFGELNEKQDEYLKDIYASGQHLLSLINDILDLSKIEAGRMELEVTDFDLPSAIDNALILVRERASRRGITLGHSVDERLGTIRGDERKVKQVLLNLLSNALKFTPEGGRIDVRAAPRDAVAEISVADTGVGIAPEDQEAVFEEFRQVGSADKKVEGTGLGLALSRKFIELHGGRIWVTSELGVGSTFRFTLPST